MLREVVARSEGRHRAHLGGVGAVRVAGTSPRSRSTGPSCPAARRHHRPPARLAVQRRAGRRRRRLKQLEARPRRPPRCGSGAAAAALEADAVGGREEQPAALLAADPWEWRALWMDGLAAVQQEDWDDAKASFNAVYQQVPGELAPKLALAFACEKGGRRRSPRASTRPAPPPTRRTSPRRRSGWPGCAPPRRHRRCGRRARPGADDQPRLPGEPAAARRGAARGRGDDLAVLDQAMTSIDGSDGPDDRATAVGADPRAGARGGHAGTGRATVRDRLVRGHRAVDPRRPRERATARWPATPTTATRRCDLVNQANAVRNWTLT